MIELPPYSDEFKEAAARRQKLEDRIMDRNQRGGHIGIGADKALSKAQIEDLWEVWHKDIRHWIVHLGGQLPKKAIVSKPYHWRWRPDPEDGHAITIVLSNIFQNWNYKSKSIEKWMRYDG